MSKIKIKSCFLLGLGCFMSLSIFLNHKIILSACEFKHVHTEACYSYGMGPCNAAHQRSTRTTTTNAHCSHCGTSTPHTVYVNWDHCYGTGEDFELGGKRNCNRCGRQTYSWGGSSGGEHQIYKKILVCDKENQVRGKLWLENRTPDWTKDHVTLESGVEIYSGMSLPPTPYSWDEKESWVSDTVCEVSENGTFHVFARSQDGMIASDHIKVSNIDRTGPTLETKEFSETDWTKEDVVITLTAKDLQPDGSEGCGLSSTPYSFEQGKHYVEEGVFSVSQNGTFPVSLKDSLENISTVDIEVQNIDKTPPTIDKVVMLEEGWQTEGVTLQVEASEENQSGLHEYAYSLDGIQWQKEPIFHCYEDGTYQIYVRDQLENTAIFNQTVNQIDKTAPKIKNIVVHEDQILEDKVYVTIEAEDLQEDGTQGSGLHEYAYSLDGGENWQSDNSFYVEEGKLYELVVRDQLLWKSEKKIVERKHFPYPPKEELTPTVEAPKGEIKKPEIEQLPKELPQEEVKEVVIEKKEEVKEEIEENEKQEVEVVKKKVSFPKKQVEQETLVKSIPVVPWYKTDLAKRMILGTGIVFTLIGMAFLVYLFCNTVHIYCLEDTGKYKLLGRLFIHRKQEGFKIDFPEYMREASTSSSYRIRFSKIQLKWLKNDFLMIQNKTRDIEVMIQETIDFIL